MNTGAFATVSGPDTLFVFLIIFRLFAAKEFQP